MRKILAISMVAALAATVPAMAQNAGSPGAVGSVGGASGHNTPGGGVDQQRAYPDNGYTPYGYDRQPGMIEGRAAAPDYVDPEYAPRAHGNRGSGNINADERMGDRNGTDAGR